MENAWLDPNIQRRNSLTWDKEEKKKKKNEALETFKIFIWGSTRVREKEKEDFLGINLIYKARRSFVQTTK